MNEPTQPNGFTNFRQWLIRVLTALFLSAAGTTIGMLNGRIASLETKMDERVQRLSMLEATVSDQKTQMQRMETKIDRILERIK